MKSVMQDARFGDVESTVLTSAAGQEIDGLHNGCFEDWCTTPAREDRDMGDEGRAQQVHDGGKGTLQWPNCLSLVSSVGRQAASTTTD